jgi:hypothetical protein
VQNQIKAEVSRIKWMTDQLVKGERRGAEGDAANYNFLRQDLR